MNNHTIVANGNSKSNKLYPQILFASDRSILIKTGCTISKESHAAVYKIFLLLTSLKIEGIQTIHPAYNSVLVTFNVLKVQQQKMLEILEEVVKEKNTVQLPEKRIVEIPVCYENEFAPDIRDVAGHNNITVDEVIAYHTRQKYLVYFLGFSPGFPYLGGMLKEISMPRLKTPRLKVPAGSVAIGGDQTGIYPVSSPGGWRIIGKTPEKLFSQENTPPTLLQMGDYVKFVSITPDEFENRLNRENN